MFRENEAVFSYGSWLTQSMIGYCAPIGILMMLPTIAQSDTPAEQVYQYLVIAFVAGFLAFIISAIAPASVQSGRWVWLLPSAFLIFAVCSDLYFRGFAAFHAFYTGSGPMAGEEAWTLVLLTLPTWACCCYSGTMWVRRRRADPSGSGPA